MSLQIDSDRQKGPPPTTNDGWVETTEVLRDSRETFLHQMFPYLEWSDAIFHGSAGGLFLEKNPQTIIGSELRSSIYPQVLISTSYV